MQSRKWKKYRCDAAASMEVAPSCLRAVLLYLTEKGRGVSNAALNDEEMDLDYIVVGLSSHQEDACSYRWLLSPQKAL